MDKRILILGSNGQIGTVLTKALVDRYGYKNVFASDIREPKIQIANFEILDVTDKNKIAEAIDKHQINTIYHLAAILSANGEKNPSLTWKINHDATVNLFDLCVEKKIVTVFFPSSIAIYGPHTPKINTPQYTSFNPSTVYGISKLTGEMWAEYYHKRYGLDVRSIRYPGVIGWQSLPEGGTTDYAVEIYHGAIKNKYYNCFLKAGTKLPMIYMDDVIRATIELMEAPASRITVRSSYNLSGMSFTPQEIYESIKAHIPDFKIDYNPDFRQQIAESWNESIDDSLARKDWDWKPKFELEEMTKDMLRHLSN